MIKINPAVLRNLFMMKKKGRGYMPALVNGESMAGNAGRWQEGPCVAANFYYDAQTGEIKYFENYQKIPEDIKRRCLEGCFRLAVNLRRGIGMRKGYRVIDSYGIDKGTERARRVLEETVKQYNRIFGFKIEKHESKIHVAFSA